MQIRKLAASLAIAATLLHVAALSLHGLMIARLALTGETIASRLPATFIICAPSRRISNAAIATTGLVDKTSNGSGSITPTFCPVCTGGVVPALIMPDAPEPAFRVVHDPQPVFTLTPVIALARYEVMSRQIRGPPLAA